MQEVLDKILAFRKERNWEQYHTPENLAKSIARLSRLLSTCLCLNATICRASSLVYAITTNRID